MILILLLLKMIIDSHGSVGWDSADAVNRSRCDVMGYCDARGDDHQIKKETLFQSLVFSLVKGIRSL